MLQSITDQTANTAPAVAFGATRFVRIDAEEPQRTHLLNIAHVVDVDVRTNYLGLGNVLVEKSTGQTLRFTLQEAKPLLEALGHWPVLPVRPNYCETPNADRAAYIRTQRSMFAAAKRAGLDPQDGEGMRRAICVLLRTYISSRAQLTPQENEFCAIAFESGYFLPGWVVNEESDLGALQIAA